ncbi:hypothetical protein ACQEV4_39095 [Streptomyces shenzhenensis]|uniref:hypothetical protein n=1 Tax=Streptomyces shenzhenensis TaxID=943815 RepID=UPI003D920CF4
MLHARGARRSVGCSPDWLAKIEMGRQKPPNRHARELSRICACPSETRSVKRCSWRTKNSRTPFRPCVKRS